MRIRRKRWPTEQALNHADTVVPSASGGLQIGLPDIHDAQIGFPHVLLQFAHFRWGQQIVHAPKRQTRDLMSHTRFK